MTKKEQMRHARKMVRFYKREARNLDTAAGAAWQRYVDARNRLNTMIQDHYRKAKV